jgi:hypothetical protein
MVDILQRAVLRVWTDGGQGAARRNAWAAMVVDSQRARARAEAMASLQAADQAAGLAAGRAAAGRAATGQVRAHG